MGNRAIIKGVNSNLGVYVHWNGGFNSVQAFVEYCRLKGYRSPETDSYGIARLAQVIGNFFGGCYSVGIQNVESNLNEKIVEEWYIDNGIYEIENWRIVRHWNPCEMDVEAEYREHEYELEDFLVELDSCQPKSEQLGEGFLRAVEVPVEELNVGDIVFIYDGVYCKWEEAKIVDIGWNHFVNGRNVDGIFCVDKYNHGTKNVNNHLFESKYRRKSRWE